MSEQGETSTGEAEQGEVEQTEVETGGTPDLQAEVEKWKALSKKNEKRAKDNATAAAELEKVKAANMTEQERAVAEATAAGRAEGLKAGATKVAAAELKAALVGRAVDADALIEGVDLSKFVDDTGEPDAAAIVAWVDRVAPAPEEPDLMRQQFPDLGQGSRGDRAAAEKAAALNGDPLLQALKTKVGTR